MRTPNYRPCEPHAGAHETTAPWDCTDEPEPLGEPLPPITFPTDPRLRHVFDVHPVTDCPVCGALAGACECWDNDE